MSKKKGQKRISTLSELFSAPKQDRKAFMERVIEKAIARQKRTLEMANGSTVTWFDECNPEERFEGVIKADIEFPRGSCVVHGYEGEQEQYVPLPEETVPVVWKKPQS